MNNAVFMVCNVFFADRNGFAVAYCLVKLHYRNYTRTFAVAVVIVRPCDLGNYALRGDIADYQLTVYDCEGYVEVIVIVMEIIFGKFHIVSAGIGLSYRIVSVKREVVFGIQIIVDIHIVAAYGLFVSVVIKFSAVFGDCDGDGCFFDYEFYGIACYKLYFNVFIIVGCFGDVDIFSVGICIGFCYRCCSVVAELAFIKQIIVTRCSYFRSGCEFFTGIRLCIACTVDGDRDRCFFDY